MAKRTGRPSKYKKEYCDALIKHMASGLSFETFAAVIKVNQDTLHEWVKVHRAFSEAKKEAYSQSQLFYEKMGVAIMAGKLAKPNVTAWIFNMKNRFKWRDVHAPEEATNAKDHEKVLFEALEEINRRNAPPPQLNTPIVKSTK